MSSTSSQIGTDDKSSIQQSTYEVNDIYFI